MQQNTQGTGTRKYAREYRPCNHYDRGREYYTKSYSGLSEGQYDFYARAIDSAGNVDPFPAMRTITVDTTPPVITAVDGPGDTSDGTATFNVSVNEPSEVFCQLSITNGTDTQVVHDWANCRGGITYTGLKGVYVLKAKARDAGGNVSPQQSVPFTVG